MKLTEERVFILYKEILAEIEPTKSMKQVTKSTNKGEGKPFSKRWVQDICLEMERLKLIEREIDEPRCVRYMRTPKGERLLKAESLDDIRRR
ncbi:MAG: hypothetical protein Sv326_1323 (plasmid) [Candidatus Fermentimicrarchaeum limneticum]|uniref:ArnR1-like winged helix-turn-helix domain-containing protein n=1 Tax=Fermentimicrarchaeum limneticum TaxID=2795018 RepID=A0A7D6BMP0_FERL1|nr:MAG: hypothetical protein Sv326_1323 [Candidatus Fermentimicrarchaeum limneticum]